jgi:hypothetical protein
MGITEKVKGALDWLERGYFVASLFVSFGIGKGVEAVLVTLTNIPQVWITPIWLIAAGVVLACLAFASRLVTSKYSMQRPSSKLQNVLPSTLSGDPGGFDADKYFAQTYDSSLSEAIESRIKAAIYKHKDTEEREEFLLKLVARISSGYFYDSVWVYIYKAQLQLLHRLNRKPLSLDEVKSIYQSDAQQHPFKYPNYPFSAWFDWLLSQGLIFQQGTVVAISERGKDFLKFLVHYGRTEEDRPI